MLQKQDTPAPTAARRATALTIAGSDSGGGAGIQADLRTFAAFGVHGTCAITALTAQNTRGVTAVEPTSRRMLRQQIEAVLGDFRVGAIKIGMLATPALALEVRRLLDAHPAIPLVLDPVLVATTGAELAATGLAGSLQRHWLARADLLTPNIPEAERLLQRRIATPRHMLAAAHELIERGARGVLLKGGHLSGREVCDLLLTQGIERWFRQPRLRGEHHGTGCTLSAAIAAGIARGAPMEAAVQDAIAYVHASLVARYRPGSTPLTVLDHWAARR